MPAISAAQVRAARGMLDWSMMVLAKAAQVSVSTVKRFEDGAVDGVKSTTADLIQSAFEAEGIRFLPDDGNGPGLRYRSR